MNDRVPCAPPLKGLRVLDLSRFIAGPFCAQMLGDMGAEVIKVEPPSGEPARNISPIVRGGESLYFMTYNRSKKGVTLNLRHPKGRQLLRDLLAISDVLIDNFRPGVLEQMDLGQQEIERDFPKLIHATVLGFGRQGPHARLQCFDEIAQAMGGLMSICGWPDGPPTLPGTHVADMTSGIYLGMGILLALISRERTGRGQKVDVALYNAVTSLIPTAIAEQRLLGQTMSRNGNRNRGISPGNAYQAKDGYIVIEAITQGMWESLAGVMGRADLLDDPRLRTPADRRAHAEILDSLVGQWTADRDVEEIFNILTKASVACGPVRDVFQLSTDSQLEANEQVVEIDHPTAGPVPFIGIVPRLSATPGSVAAPPTLGQHNRAVYVDLLGHSTTDFEHLQRDGVI